MELTNEQKHIALMNAIPHKPRKEELGGDFYYKCYWLTCNEDLKKYYNYCPKCGAKIDWRE